MLGPRLKALDINRVRRDARQIRLRLPELAVVGAVYS
jgi:hypothetical protein